MKIGTTLARAFAAAQVLSSRIHCVDSLAERRMETVERCNCSTCSCTWRPGYIGDGKVLGSQQGALLADCAVRSHFYSELERVAGGTYLIPFVRRFVDRNSKVPIMVIQGVIFTPAVRQDRLAKEVLRAGFGEGVDLAYLDALESAEKAWAWIHDRYDLWDPENEAAASLVRKWGDDIIEDLPWAETPEVRLLKAIFGAAYKPEHR